MDTIQPPPKHMPNVLAPNRNAFPSAPTSFANRAAGAGPKKASISLNIKHPDVLAIETTTDLRALKQLKHRNDEMLSKKAFVASLPDKGQKLLDINLRIESRLKKLEESAAAAASGDSAQLQEENDIQSTEITNKNQANSDGDQVMQNADSDDIGTLERMVEGIQLNREGPKDPNGQNTIITPRKKTLANGRTISTELSPNHKVIQVKTLSFEESVSLGDKAIEDARLLQARLLASAGVMAKKPVSDVTFDKTKYRSAVGPLPTDSDSDDSENDSENSEWED
ncbi:hypothetical protein BDR26DRAFT_868374 [Obelidium mucronatum]|nr:hypothetical protein BDR26DRAFT_868374 [Obelidium mucronatum]